MIQGTAKLVASNSEAIIIMGCNHWFGLRTRPGTWMNKRKAVFNFSCSIFANQGMWQILTNNMAFRWLWLSHWLLGCYWGEARGARRLCRPPRQCHRLCFNFCNSMWQRKHKYCWWSVTHSSGCWWLMGSTRVSMESPLIVEKDCAWWFGFVAAVSALNGNLQECSFR